MPGGSTSFFLQFRFIGRAAGNMGPK